jgi:hypothetical protein
VLEECIDRGIRNTLHIDNNFRADVGWESRGHAAQVIALKHHVESDGCSWPHLDGKGQCAIAKDALGERGLHLFTTTSTAAHLGAVLLENQKCRVALSLAVGRWDVEGTLPATSDVLKQLGVCCNGGEEEKEA